MKRPGRTILRLTFFAMLVACVGCRSIERLGDREKFNQALGNALKSKTVLLPAIGAGIFSVGSLDEDTSDWASRHTIIFGSRTTAKDFSDYGVYALQGETAVTAILASSVEESESWYSRAERPAVEFLTFTAVYGTTSGLKNATSRQRPDCSNDRSFPSGHASQAFALTTLSNRNLEYIGLSDESKRQLRFTNFVLASAVGWGRIEGGKHYPSDVLAGAALGNFFGIFIHDWLIGNADDELTVSVTPLPNGFAAGVGFSF